MKSNSRSNSIGNARSKSKKYEKYFKKEEDPLSNINIIFNFEIKIKIQFFV